MRAKEDHLMPRTAQQNQVIRDKRKTKITAEGIKLISLKGLNNVVIDDIAREVGCSHGLFYHYYKKTEDLYAAIPEYFLGHKKLLPLCSLCKDVAAAGGTEGIKLLADGVAKLPNCPSILVHIVNIAVNNIESLKFFNAYEPIKALIEAGQKDGTVKDGEVDDLILILISAIKGYVLGILAGGSPIKSIPGSLFAGILLK